VGLILEAYGFWLLFMEFIPTALQFFRRVPFMSRVLEMPFMKAVGVVCSQLVPWMRLSPLMLPHAHRHASEYRNIGVGKNQSCIKG